MHKVGQKSTEEKMNVTLKKVKNGYMASNGAEEVFVAEVCPEIEALMEGESVEEEAEEDMGEKADKRIRRVAEDLEGKPKGPKYVDMGEMGEEEDEEEKPKKKGFFGRLK